MIKFDVAEMNRVYNRIDGMKNQLKTAFSNNVANFSAISETIQTDSLKTIISAYNEGTTNKCSDIIAHLEELQAHLKEKLVNYSEINEHAEEEVESINTQLGEI